MKREENKQSSQKQSAPQTPVSDHLGKDSMLGSSSSKLPQQHKAYAIPYDKHGHLRIPIKSTVNPYDKHAPVFGGGFPAVTGGNVEEDESGPQAISREFSEEMAPYGFKLTGLSKDLVHQESYTAGKGKHRREVVMSFIEATVAPAFGMKPEEIASAGPEYQETAGVATVDPSKLGLDNTAKLGDIMVAMLRAVGIDPTTKEAAEWMKSGTATAIAASLRGRLPKPQSSTSTLD